MSKIVGIHTRQIAVMRDEKTSGTAGGASSTSYASRILNTLVDPSGLVVNSSSFTGVGGTNTTFVLNAGTYRMNAVSPTYAAGTSVLNDQKAKLYNVTDSVDVLIGTSERNTPAVNVAYTNTSKVQGVFTLTKQTTLALQQRTSTAQATGLGNPNAFGDVEVYAIVEIEKIS